MHGSYFLRFTDSVRLMKASFNSPVNNLSDEIFKTKCKHCKICERV